MKKFVSAVLLAMAMVFSFTVVNAEEENATSVVTEHGAIDHTEYYKNGKLIEEATCKDSPVIGRVFYEDGYYEDMVVEIPHKWGKWTGSATCTEGGTETRTCSVCGAKETRTVEALGHLWSSEVDAPDKWGKIIEDATCEKEGYALDYCKRCGVDGEKTRVIEKLDHAFNTVVIDEVPACDEEFPETKEIKNGKYHKTCDFCGTPEVDEEGEIVYTEITLEEYQQMIEDPEYDGHDWDAWVYEIAPKCDTEGKAVRWCKHCGVEEYQPVPALNHNDYEALELVEEHLADCFHRYDIFYCPLCKETVYGMWVNGEFEEISEDDVKNGNTDAFFETESHYYEFTEDYLVEKVDPTCTEDGHETYKCVYHDEVAGHDEGDYKTIVLPALGHDWIGWVCEHKIGENGNEYGHWVNTCRVCGATKDFNGNYTPEPCKDDSHEFELKDTVAATCEKAGSEFYVCKLCGETKTVELEALGHVYTEEVIKAATCTEAGKSLLTCSVCGSIKTEEIAALGHTEEEIAAVDPTCTEAGATAGKKCSVCGEVLVAPEEVAALGHTEEEIPAVEATCTEAGSTAGKKCSVCGEVLVEPEEVAALGHTVVVDEAVPATTTSTGLTEGSHCSVCGEVLVAQEEVPVLKDGLTQDEDGEWRLYDEGEFQDDFNGIVEYDDGEFFVANGVLCDEAQGLNQNVDGKWYFLANGQIQRVDGYVEYDNHWFLVKNGELDLEANGLKDYNGGSFLFAAGKLQYDYSGLWQDADGTWYYLANGQVQNVTTLVQYDGAWFYVVDGKLAVDFTGEVEYSGSTFNVVAGQVY